MANEMKIQKVSAADLVFDAMKQCIVTGKWVAGEKIPTEVQLSEMFGVNRLTVRVALQRMQALGLLDIRVGDGTYVRKFDMCANIVELSPFYSSETNSGEVREYRLYLEARVVKLASQRRTESELQDYWNVYTEMAEHVDRFFAAEDSDTADYELKLQVDLSVRIHMILCGMAHNELLKYAFAIVQPSIRQLMLINIVNRMKEPGPTKAYLRMYEDLYYSLKQQDKAASVEMIKKIMDIDLDF